MAKNIDEIVAGLPHPFDGGDLDYIWRGRLLRRKAEVPVRAYAAFEESVTDNRARSALDAVRWTLDPSPLNPDDHPDNAKSSVDLFNEIVDHEDVALRDVLVFFSTMVSDSVARPTTPSPLSSDGRGSTGTTSTETTPTAPEATSEVSGFAV